MEGIRTLNGQVTLMVRGSVDVQCGCLCAELGLSAMPQEGGEESEKLDVHRKAHECCAPRAGQVRQVRARCAPLDSFAQHARVGAKRPRARFRPEVTGPLSRGARSPDRHA